MPANRERLAVHRTLVKKAKKVVDALLQAADRYIPAGYFDAEFDGSHPSEALFIGVTWSLAIAHLMSIAQLLVVLVTEFAPRVAFRMPFLLSESPHDFWGARLDLAFQLLLKSR